MDRSPIEDISGINNIIRSSTSKLRLIELYVWMFFGILVVLPYMIRAIRHPNYTEMIINDNYGYLLLAVLIILFPILFRLVFDAMPFEYLKNWREVKFNALEEAVVNPNLSQVSSPTIPAVNTTASPVTDYRRDCINQSHAIAEKIFLRAGVYLLIGCLIAFCGVAIFYSPWFTKEYQSPNTEKLISYKAPADTASKISVKIKSVQAAQKEEIPTTFWSSEFGLRILAYIPRFGALFFVEFIAFFFLRQYRIMLEEYRYYEAVKRKRQDSFNVVNLFDKYEDKPEILKAILSMTTDQSYQSKLAKDETTPLLETHKLLNQETDFLGKLTDLLKQVKG